MSKAFTRESDGDDEDEDEDSGGASGIAAGRSNYMTPEGHRRLRAELLHLLDEERPRTVEIVSWAASNGDRSENGDYLYGKKRLREIDRRIRHLTRRLDVAVVADPSVHPGTEQVFFGATVTVENLEGQSRTVTIKGIDEADPLQGEVSWISPIAQALLKSRVGDEVTVHTPLGREVLEVVAVQYPAPAAPGLSP